MTTALPSSAPVRPDVRGPRVPARLIAAAMALAFAVLAAQLVRLALVGQLGGVRLQAAEPIVRTYSRPDILDRKGRLLATDLHVHSLFADPSLVGDADEAAEKLATVLPDLDPAELRALLADRARRFVWIRRGLPPVLAQRLHDLGLPGLAFRTEPRRAYPQGRLAGHVLGGVSVDNKGLAGLERHIDEAMGLEPGVAIDSGRPPVSLTIDLGAQHGLEEELSVAMARYRASGAAGVILDVANGGILAAVSLPDVDPSRPVELQDPEKIDRVQTATYELGSIFKAFTVAMALDSGQATPGTLIDVRVPLQAGGWTIRDLHNPGRPLSVREVLIQSSNVGAARLALSAGAAQQKAFLARAGLLEPMRTEAGPVSPPRAPERWGEAEVATIAYGHGLAVTPLQFAAAAAALVNGGVAVRPTFIRQLPGFVPAEAPERRVLRPETSAAIRDMLRRAVSQPNGTGRRADAQGFEVGGKTGTAEIAVRGAYQAKSVVASFLAAFPISAPRYVVLVTLVEPKPVEDSGGQITAGVNAAPVAARVISRTGPLLGVMPR